MVLAKSGRGWCARRRGSEGRHGHRCIGRGERAGRVTLSYPYVLTAIAAEAAEAPEAAKAIATAVAKMGEVTGRNGDTIGGTPPSPPFFWLCCCCCCCSCCC